MYLAISYKIQVVLPNVQMDIINHPLMNVNCAMNHAELVQLIPNPVHHVKEINYLMYKLNNVLVLVHKRNLHYWIMVYLNVLLAPMGVINVMDYLYVQVVMKDSTYKIVLIVANNALLDAQVVILQIAYHVHKDILLAHQVSVFKIFNVHHHA